MIKLSRFFKVEPAWRARGIGARRNRLKPSDLLLQLEQCVETQPCAVSAPLEAFDPDSFAGLQRPCRTRNGCSSWVLRVESPVKALRCFKYELVVHSSKKVSWGEHRAD